jgi:hypothetical protein
MSKKKFETEAIRTQTGTTRENRFLRTFTATPDEQVLAAIRGDFDVIEAKHNLDNHLESVKLVFEQFGAGQPE